jgi:hypothetical protein
VTTRADILKRIAKAAKVKGIAWELDREGGNHSIYKLDGLQVPIGRHKGEVGNRYAETVYKECEPKLGKDWWRK